MADLPVLTRPVCILLLQAKNLKNQPGGLEQAKRESESARKLAIAAIITGCAIVFLTIFFTVILPIILGGVFAATAAATYDDDF